jgi:hypothetical protein
MRLGAMVAFAMGVFGEQSCNRAQSTVNERIGQLASNQDQFKQIGED